MTLSRQRDDAAIVEPENLDASLEAEGRLEKSSDAFRTIGEAAAELGLKTHVLRFWETKFDDLRPMKRPDGRRYYRPEDMEVLRTLQRLLHEQGLTIRGALKALKDGEGIDLADVETAEDEAESPAGVSVRDLQNAVRDAVDRGDFKLAAESTDASPARARLETLLEELTGLKSRLDKVRLAG